MKGMVKRAYSDIALFHETKIGKVDRFLVVVFGTINSRIGVYAFIGLFG